MKLESDGRRKPKRQKLAKAAGVPLEEMSMDDFLGGGFEAALGQNGQGSHIKERASAAKHSPDKLKAKKARSSTDLATSNVDKPIKRRAKGEREPGRALSLTPKKTPPDQQTRPSATAEKARMAVEPQPKKRKRVSEAEQHQYQLQALKETDPEFFKYLLETDKELLEFKTEDSDDEEEDLEVVPDAVGAEDAALEGEELKGSQDSQLKGSKRDGVLSQSLVDRWCYDAKEKDSAAAFDRLMKAYRVACHLGDQEDSMDATMKITSSTVFNKILLFMIKEAGQIIRRKLGLENCNLTVEAVRKASRWKKIEPLVKSFLGNSLHLLTEMTDEAMTVFLLRHLRPMVPFLISSDRLQRKFLKHVLRLFGQAQTRVRVQTVLFLRQMAIQLPPPFTGLAMKGVYRTFVVNAKFMSPANLPHINFMASCVVEIFGLDTLAAYEHAFGYLRQLAILVKNAQSQKSKEAFREVYCWQTLSSLELWAKLLSTHSSNTELRPLVYPTAQLLMATVRLVPTATYFPLRLRCVKALNKLAHASGTFIPVAPLLLEVLQWSGLSKAAKSGGRPPSDAVPQLKAGKQMLESIAYQQSLVDEVFMLLSEHLAQWSTSVSFPEYANTVVLHLQQVAKHSKVERFRSAAKGLIAAVRVNSEFVLKRRQRLDCGPSQIASLPTFLSSPSDKAKAPMSTYAAVLAEAAARKRDLQSSAEVAVGAEAEQEGDSNSEAEEMPATDLLPQLRKRSAAKKAGKPEMEDPEPGLQAGTVEIDADDVRDFELSESEEDSEDNA